MSPNAREMTLPTVLRSDWLIVPTRPRKSALNRTCSNFWIVRLTRFRDTRVRSVSLPHDTIYSVARQSGVFLRINRTVWRGLYHGADGARARGPPVQGTPQPEGPTEQKHISLDNEVLSKWCSLWHSPEE